MPIALRKALQQRKKPRIPTCCGHVGALVKVNGEVNVKTVTPNQLMRYRHI